MISLIVIAFLIAGFQAIHGLTPFSSITDGLIPLLLMAEHGLNGNTGTVVNTVVPTTTIATTTVEDITPQV